MTRSESVNSNLLNEEWVRPEFWNRLAPGLTITEHCPLAERSNFGAELVIRPDDWDICRQLIHSEGYFAYDSWLDTHFIDRLSACFLNLEAAKFPPIFAFVFDEFWDLLLQLDPLLSDLIDDYEIPSAVWAWLVQASHQSAFAPHRDQVREASVDDEDHLDYLTIWVPLTDLNHLSSSICLLPAPADPDYDTGTNRVNVDNLQEIRCLQGKRGSVFGWTTGLVHWGTRQSRWGGPRMSIGATVQNPDAVCFDPPVLDFYDPLSLNQRLNVIGQQIINYSRDASIHWLEIARRLTELDAE